MMRDACGDAQERDDREREQNVVNRGDEGGYAHADLEADCYIREQQHERDGGADRGAPDELIIRLVFDRMICDGDDGAVGSGAELLLNIPLQLGHKGLQFALRAAGNGKLHRIAERGRIGGAFARDIESRVFDLTAAVIIERLTSFRGILLAERTEIVGNFDHIVVVHGRIGVESHKSEQERARNEDNQADCEADEQTLFRDGLTHLPFPPS